ncbi:response regulator [Paenibacillus chondroitinus]|uniref:Response regulator n=1 Tax=Paenibacillus chondroitinus TaxID=59842 RepID=A0ABU6DF18_9BACL|nr:MULTISPECIES: response regulator [Paenibacillus]MCY9659896.1 response regulator [Paenibacillus anseongense]MEB4795486.1 response regulator [Paenibacillus chondroitinus]
MSELPCILIAEDELPTRNGIMKALQTWSEGKINLQVAENGMEAFHYRKTNPVDLLITDIRMPGLNGIQLLERLKKEGLQTKSILLTGYAEFEYARKALTLGAVNYILKPVEFQNLISAVEEAFEENKLWKRVNHDSSFIVPQVLNDSIRKSLVYISAELWNPSLGIKDVAEHIHLNSSYVSVLFKEETGYTFSDYLTRLRLFKSKELLLGTDMKIYEVAERTGFSSSKYFVKVFREAELLTPKEFRNEHKKMMNKSGFGHE